MYETIALSKKKKHDNTQYHIIIIFTYILIICKFVITIGVFLKQGGTTCVGEL